MKVKKMNDKVLLVSTDSDKQLAEIFMRFQEHYENPEWAGKIFTVGQLRKWYSDTYGANTYCRDWVGFNFPDYALKAFKDGLFDPLTDQERELLDLVRYKTEKFYIIGGNDEAVILHEMAHAKYYLNDKYRQEADKICASYDRELTKLKQWLLNTCYSSAVLNDEIQAYLLYGGNGEIIESIDKKVCEKFRKCFDKHDFS